MVVVMFGAAGDVLVDAAEGKGSDSRGVVDDLVAAAGRIGAATRDDSGKEQEHRCKLDNDEATQRKHAMQLDKYELDSN